MPNRDRPAFLAFSSDDRLTVSTMWRRTMANDARKGRSISSPASLLLRGLPR